MMERTHESHIFVKVKSAIYFKNVFNGRRGKKIEALWLVIEYAELHTK